jgi:hypothetical protein
MLCAVQYSTLCRDCVLLYTIHPAASSGHDAITASFEPVFHRWDHRTAGSAVLVVMFVGMCLIVDGPFVHLLNISVTHGLLRTHSVLRELAEDSCNE